MTEGSLEANCLLINGRVYTMDPGWPWASTLAIAGDRILAVGEDLRSLLSPRGEVVDLGGRCVIPGLIDSHIHFTSFALGLRELDLRQAESLDQLLSRVLRHACDLNPGQEWVLGHGWDQERWHERRFPTAADLDLVERTRPILLQAKSGHAIVVNSQALRMAGITSATPEPPGGRIGRDAEGQPNGLLFEESAMRLVADLVPHVEPTEIDSALRDAFPLAWGVGLTAIHDMDGAAAFAAYQRLHVLGPLGLRVVKYLPVDMLDDVLEMRVHTGGGDNWLRVGGIKVFADGALGPRTAAMLAPYEGEPENTGVLTVEEETLRTLAHQAASVGLPLAVHAIGDRANRLALDALAGVGPRNMEGSPQRIEHVQLLDPQDVARFGELGIVASMQPIHAPQDAAMAQRYWGERCATAYAWRSLLDAGAMLAFGSDSPVEDLNPILGIYAAVTRCDPDGALGPEGWYPEQRLTIEAAVRAYTLGAAYAGGVEDRLGTLVPGKLADLVVLDRDIFTCPPAEIREARVVATMIGGQFVYGGL